MVAAFSILAEARRGSLLRAHPQLTYQEEAADNGTRISISWGNIQGQRTWHRGPCRSLHHLSRDGEELEETSIDRMTEENDTSAPLEDICVMLCDRLIDEREIVCSAPESGFFWVEGKVLAQVHNGIQDHH
jgi:hypothetical protein